MALHIHQIWIEYDERPGYHPVSVYVKRGTRIDPKETAEFHGRKLKPLLSKAVQHIHEQEAEEGMV